VKLAMCAGWDMFKGAVKWGHKEFCESAENFARDLRSTRILWAWVFLALYVWESVWGMLFHAKELGAMIIGTTGGMASWIITNYVVSSHMDKRLAKQVPGLTVGPEAPAASGEEGDG